MCAEDGLKDSFFFFFASKLSSLGARLRPRWKKMRPEKWHPRQFCDWHRKDFSSPELVLHTAWRKVFFRCVCVARSEVRGGSLDCSEGGPCRFNNFQKSSSLYRRHLHANVGHPISAGTDTFHFVRRLARNIALATESWSISTRRQSSRVQESQTGPAYSSTGRTRLM